MLINNIILFVYMHDVFVYTLRDINDMVIHPFFILCCRALQVEMDQWDLPVLKDVEDLLVLRDLRE